jgi:O-antigen/teichoic acid export membrane protein
MIKNKLKELAKKNLVKNLGFLISGTVLAQIVVVGVQVVLRRIYTAEEFGVFGVYMSALGILATISAFRYEQTIVLPKEQAKSKGLLLLSIGISFLFSTVLLLPIFFYKLELASWLNFPDPAYADFLLLLPLSVFVFSVVQALNFYLIKLKLFKILGSNKVVRRGSEGFLQVALGKLDLGFGLIVGDMLGQIAVAVRSIHKLSKGTRSDVRKQSIKELAIRYKNFPLQNGLPALMNSLGLLLPFIIIAQKFSVQENGYFELARMVLIIPLSLITASLSQVILERFSEKKNNSQSVLKEVKAFSLGLIVLGLLFGLVISLFGELLFSWVFGAEWKASGQYASILVWAFALKFLVSPFNIVFTVFERIGLFSLWQVLYAVLIVLLWFIPFQDIMQFFKGYLFIELVIYTLAAVLSTRVLYSYECSIAKGGGAND